jgi:hypothetical protein
MRTLLAEIPTPCRFAEMQRRIDRAQRSKSGVAVEGQCSLNPEDDVPTIKSPAARFDGALVAEPGKMHTSVDPTDNHWKRDTTGQMPPGLGVGKS